MTGVVTRLMLYHGAQVDLGAEYDGWGFSDSATCCLDTLQLTLGSAGGHARLLCMGPVATGVKIAPWKCMWQCTTVQDCLLLQRRPKDTRTLPGLSTPFQCARSAPGIVCSIRRPLPRRLIPITHEEWTEDLLDAAYIDQEVQVRVHKVRPAYLQSAQASNNDNHERETRAGPTG